MALKPEKLIGKAVSYRKGSAKEVANIADVTVLENIYGDIDVTYELTNGEVIEGGDAFFDRKVLALAKA